MKAVKVFFLVLLITVSLCVLNAYPVMSQEAEIITIKSDGTVVTSTGNEVSIVKTGNVYTLTDNINHYYLVVECDDIVIDGAGYALGSYGDVGIDLSNRTNVTVKNMKIELAFYGINLWNTTRSTLDGNTITNNGFGMFLLEASQNTVTNNKVTNNTFGIALENSSSNILRDNILNNNYNLGIYGTQNFHFNNDIDNSNIANGKKVYYLINENNLIISPSTFPDIGYLALVNCENITVSNLELTHNTYGLLLAYTVGTTINQNMITNNSVGIGLIAATGNDIVNNTIIENSRGIQLSASSTSNSIYTNNVSNNGEGMFFFGSSQNMIVENNITNSKSTGVGFNRASDNIFGGNFFVNNPQQVYDVGAYDNTIQMSTNRWDFSYPVGGNYWSDYAGVDVKSGAGQNQTGSDGIGDTAYLINTNNRDNYPLMPYGSPIAISVISPQNKTYTTTDVLLDFDVNEATTWIKYSLDGQANATITESIIMSNLAEGMHSVTVYVQNTEGQTRTSGPIYFTISQEAEPSQAFPMDVVIIIAAVAIVTVVGVIYLIKRRK